MIEANREYVANKVLSASPMELVRILYETALDSVNKAIFYLRSGDIMERGHAITKTSEAIGELRASLRPGVDDSYSNNLDQLYAYLQRQLFKAHVEKSEPILIEVSRLLGVLLDGWVGAIKSHVDPAEQMDLFDPNAPAPPKPETPYVEAAQGSGAGGRSWQF